MSRPGLVFPSLRPVLFIAVLTISALSAQDRKIAARIDGHDWTAAAIQNFIDGYPAQVRKGYAQNPADVLGNLLMQEYLAREAERHALDKSPQFLSDFAWAKLNLLAQAEVNHAPASYTPQEAEMHQFYEKNRKRWSQAWVRAIFVPASNRGDMNSAYAQIQAIRTRIEKGASFAAVAQESSEEKASAVKGGDWGWVTRASAYPETILNAIFLLREGEISQPVLQPNGYYLLKLERLRTTPYSEVEESISAELRQQHAMEWINRIKSASAAKVLSRDYLSSSEAAGDGDDDDDVPRRPGEPPPTHPLARSAEAARPEPPNETSAARMLGKTWTVGELKAFIRSFPSQVQTSYAANHLTMLNNILFLKELSRLAQEQRLDQDAGVEKDLQWARTNLLSKAELSRARTASTLSSAELQRQYDSDPQRWEQATARVIRIGFSVAPEGSSANPAPGGPTRPEAEAQKIAFELTRQLAAGANFGAVAREHSDDPLTAAAGGALAPITRGTPYPEPLKSAIFSLEPGRIGAPVRLPDAFYILKLESLRKQPLAAVEQTLRDELRQSHFNEWFNVTKSRFTADIKDPEFFTLSSEKRQ